MKTLQKILGISTLAIAPILYGCGEADNTPVIHKPKLPAEAPIPEPPKPTSRTITGIVIGEAKSNNQNTDSYAFSIKSESGIYSFIIHYERALLSDSRIDKGDKVTVCLDLKERKKENWHENSYALYDKQIISVVKAEDLAKQPVEQTPKE